jgi:hypothetical protein
MQPPENTGDARSRRALILTMGAVLGIVIGVTTQRWNVPQPEAATRLPAPSVRTSAPLTAKVDPVSESGTSFTSRDGGWRSQTYNDTNFGNLKKGIGLRLDLGTQRPLTAITFTAQNGPMTVELRAGDKPSSRLADYRLVGSAVQANGPTRLRASTGGSHRYWMVWVTKLPPTFQARITGNPVARG